MRPLDIAVATRQNWANLVSILDRDGDPGEVLWVETPTALRCGWSRGTSEILRREGRTILEPIILPREVEEDPAAFEATLVSRLDRARELRIHLNGGTKLTQAVLNERAGAQAISHYVDGRRFHTRQGGNWSHRPLTFKPDLADILLSYGFEAREPGLTRLKLIGDLRVGGDLHRAFMDNQAKAFPELAQGSRDGRWYAFSKNLEWLLVTLQGQGHGDAPERLLEIVGNPKLLDDLAAGFFAKELERVGPKDGKIRNLWFSFKKNLLWLVESRKTWVNAQSGPSPMALAFEARVGDSLDAICGGWEVPGTLRNVHVFPKGSDFAVAELDAVWVLPGGQIAVFECKLGTQEDKSGFRVTLRSRTKAYEEAMGIHARPFLVLPARPAPNNPKYLQPLLQDMAEVAEDLGWRTLLMPDGGSEAQHLEPFGEIPSLEAQIRNHLPS